MTECPSCGFQLTPSNMSRAKRLPKDWQPTAKMLTNAHAIRPDVDPQREAVLFRNYWTAKAGKDAAKLDWDATWCNWIMNAKASPQRPSEPKRQPEYKPETKGKPAKLGEHLAAIAKDLGIT